MAGARYLGVQIPPLVVVIETSRMGNWRFSRPTVRSGNDRTNRRVPVVLPLQLVNVIGSQDSVGSKNPATAGIKCVEKGAIYDQVEFSAQKKEFSLVIQLLRFIAHLV